jgi:hypothetical protein
MSKRIASWAIVVVLALLALITRGILLWHTIAA